jgi:hypothetical protein
VAVLHIYIAPSCFAIPLALRHSLPEVALFFCDEATLNNSLGPTNAMAFVIDAIPHVFHAPDDLIFQHAVDLNNHALARNSLDGRRHRVRYLTDEHDFAQAIAYYAFHYEGSSSILSAFALVTKQSV